MKGFSDFVDRILLHDDLLRRLLPTESFNPMLVVRVREADDATLAGGPIGQPEAFLLVRGALFYALDALHDAHVLFQKGSGDLDAYWHGMVHRREGDFENARYWFRRAGELPFFGSLHHAASNTSELVARQMNWDPYLFTGQCEQARYGEPELVREMAALQRIEFDTVFEYTWRQSRVG